MSCQRFIRVALLICGGLTGSVRDKNGDYYDIYRRYLEAALPPESNTTLVVDGFDVVTEIKYPKDDQLKDYDAIILTGSAASAYENIEWINRLVFWTQRVVNEHPEIKIIAICFGHQILSRVLGGRCVPNGGVWEVGPTTLHLTDVGRSLFGVGQLTIQQMHRDHVPLDSLPGLSSDIHLLASTDVSQNQGFVKFIPGSSSTNKDISPKNIQIITLQGHPEFTEQIVTGIIRQRSASGVMNGSVVESYFGRVGDHGDSSEPENKEGTGRRWWSTDGIDIIGKVFWKILGADV